MWPILELNNGYEIVLVGLAKNKEFRDLSKKRITTCVREALRVSIGNKPIKVACSAQFDQHKNEWSGICQIGEHVFHYRIVET